MATITITVGAQTKNWTVSAGDATRIINSLKTHYGQVFDPTLGTPVGTPPTPPGAMRDRTNAEVFDLVANGFMQSLKDITKRQEGIPAHVAAEAAIVPIVAA